MYPFTLDGPSFLLFYAILALLLLLSFAYWKHHMLQSGSSGHARISGLTADPYKIAYLRGGDSEVVRVAVVNLVDRGLLTLGKATRTLRRSESADPDSVRRPVDRALLAFFDVASSQSNALKSAHVRAACEEYRQELAKAGLALNDTQKRDVFNGLAVVLGIAGGIAVLRIAQALMTGRHNIIFLIILAAISCWIAYRIAKRERTPKGSRALRSLRALTARLKSRARSLNPGGATNEALLLAAVFGIYALPAAAFPFVNQLYRKDSGGGGDSGGGDGGGGCGGGCGGCGGD